MMKIREILLTDYIGAITIAFLIADGLIAVITGVVRTVTAYFYISPGTRSAFDSPTRHVQWGTLIAALVTCALCFTAAYLLAIWLYASAFRSSRVVSIPDAQIPSETENR